MTSVCTQPLPALKTRQHLLIPRGTLQTSCFRRPLRSHGLTLTLAVPEPLCRVVLLSSAKTLRRVCGLHATPAGLRIQQHPPISGTSPDRFSQASILLSQADLNPHGSRIALTTVSLSSAETLRRNSGVHATPVGDKGPTAPPALVSPGAGPYLALPRERTCLYRGSTPLSIVLRKKPGHPERAVINC